MNESIDPLLQHKQMAADYAVEYVKSGMVVGLGHGSTAILAVRKIAQLLESGQISDIVGIPCSKFIEQEAIMLSIPVGDLQTHPNIDLTIDGADEVDPKLNLIKGGGGALLKEKLVAKASDREMIIIDESKYSTMLGTNWPLPIEVDAIHTEIVISALANLTAIPTLRYTPSGHPFVTDSGNSIIDANFGAIADPAALASKLDSIEGIVDHGLFLGIATDVIIAGLNGVRHLKREA